MSKVIVVDKCKNCKFERVYSDEVFCWETGTQIDIRDTILDDCPLPDLPEKIIFKQEEYSDPLKCVSYGMTLGWNSCIGAITKNEKDEDR